MYMLGDDTATRLLVVVHDYYTCVIRKGGLRKVEDTPPPYVCESQYKTPLDIVQGMVPNSRNTDAIRAWLYDVCFLLL